MISRTVAFLIANLLCAVAAFPQEDARITPLPRVSTRAVLNETADHAELRQQFRAASPRPEPVVHPVSAPPLRPNSLQRLPDLPEPEQMPFTSSEAFVAPPSSPLAQDELPPPNRQMQIEAVQAASLLDLEDVLRSVAEDYPLLLAALQERGITTGEVVAARAPFNTQVDAKSSSHPVGFYEYSYSDFQVTQPTWNAGNAYAGYMIGRGNFPVWYGNLATNKGGEFRIGYQQALLQGLAIDKRRADLLKAQIGRRAAEPQIYKARIDFLRIAAIGYWEWVAEGRKYVIADQILRTAKARDAQLQERARLEDIAPLDVVDNRRIVVDREARLIGSARRFQESAIRLSLFLRDRAGRPLVPEPNRLPRTFPSPELPSVERLGDDIQIALRNRPELRQLALKRQATSISLELAQNQVLPTLNAYAETSKDVGTEVDLGNKTPTVFESGVVGGIPIQRSAARGAIRTNQALLAQLTAETRWAEDKIATDVQSAMAALVAAYQQLEPARQGVQLNYQMENAERQKWLAGDSTLFLVNLRELATAEAASIEVDALANYQIAVANYRAALGLDGLNYTQATPFGNP